MSYQLGHIATEAYIFLVCRATLHDLGLIPSIGPPMGLSKLSPPMKGISPTSKDTDDTLAVDEGDGIIGPTRMNPPESPWTIPHGLTKEVGDWHVTSTSNMCMHESLP